MSDFVKVTDAVSGKAVCFGMVQMAERSAAQQGLWRAKCICLPYLLSAGDERK